MPQLIGLLERWRKIAKLPTDFQPTIDAELQKALLNDDKLHHYVFLANIRSLWIVLSKTAEGKSALVEAGITPFGLQTTRDTEE